MLGEFSAYINYVLGGDSVSFDNGYTPDGGNESYYDWKETFKKSADDDEIDYKQFIYASGKVNFGEFKNSDLFNPESAQYKAMSAVN